MKKIYTLCIIFITGYLTNAQNHSLDFDGIDDYVTLGDNFAFEPGDAFSIEAWVKINTINLKQIVSKLGVESGTFRGWGLQTNSSGFLSAYVSTTWQVDTRYAQGLTQLADNNWHHVAMTYDGADEILLYIDGLPETLDFVDVLGSITTLQTSSTARIGSFDFNGTSSEHFRGGMDEVRIWSDVRTPQEILENYDTELAGTENNLIGYYKMDIANSTCDIQDCSASQIHGTRLGNSGPNQTPQFSEEVPDLVDVPCSTSTDCELSISDNSHNDSIQLFPNPSTGIITILNYTADDKTIRVFDSLGKEVQMYTTPSSTLNLSNLKAGIYFIEIAQENRNIIKRVIKQ